MRILILNWRDPSHPYAGGAEKSILEHAKYWLKKGADVTWYSSSFESSKKQEIINGIKIIRVGSHYTTHLMFIFYCLLGKFNGYSVIIDCFHFLPYFTPLFMRKEKKIALIQETGGNLWFKNISPPFAVIGFLLEPLFFLFYKDTVFITASESTKKDLLKFGIKKNMIQVILHGVDFKDIKANKEKTPTVLYLGLLSKDKGLEDAIKAFIEIRRKIPSAKLWIAGREQKREYLNSVLKSLKLTNSKDFITYYGYVTEKVKFELFKKSWILLHPSEKEGWGLNVIEAATQGTPTVGYNVAGLRDSIKHKQTGILTDPNFFSLGKEAIGVISDKNLYNSLSKEAILWSRNFSWKSSGKASFNLLTKLNEK